VWEPIEERICLKIFNKDIPKVIEELDFYFTIENSIKYNI